MGVFDGNFYLLGANVSLCVLGVCYLIECYCLSLLLFPILFFRHSLACNQLFLPLPFFSEVWAVLLAFILDQAVVSLFFVDLSIDPILFVHLRLLWLAMSASSLSSTSQLGRIVEAALVLVEAGPVDWGHIPDVLFCRLLAAVDQIRRQRGSDVAASSRGCAAVSDIVCQGTMAVSVLHSTNVVVLVRTMAGAAPPFEAPFSSSIGQVKLIVQGHLGVPVWEQQLIHDCCVLQDSAMVPLAALVRVFPLTVGLDLVRVRAKSIITFSSDCSAKLWGAESGACLVTLEGHGDVVTCVAVSADGSQIVSSSRDCTAKLWCRDSGSCTMTFYGHSDIVVSAVFSVESSTVLTASLDNTARIWCTETGDCVMTFHGHICALCSAVFSADGATVLTASHDMSAKLWIVASGLCAMTLDGRYGPIHDPLTFDGHSRPINLAVFSADAATVLTASQDSTAKLWSIASGRCTMTFDGHADSVVSAVFSADGGTVLTGSWDDTARLWCIQSGGCVMIFDDHEFLVVSAVFSPDGVAVLTASEDGTAKLWSTITGEYTMAFRGHCTAVHSAVFSADGASVLTASGDGSAKLWVVDTGDCRMTFRGHDCFKSVHRAFFIP